LEHAREMSKPEAAPSAMSGETLAFNGNTVWQKLRVRE
jgi:hypothetical protein